MLLTNIFHLYLNPIKPSLLLSSGVHVPQDDDLTRGPVELPPSEYQDMRTNGGSSVPISAERGLTLKLALLPDQLVVSVKDNEVVDV